VLALGLWSQVRQHNLTVADPQPSAATRPLPKPARSGAPGWRSHIAFCDYLERHPEIAREYSALKQGLADRFPNDRGAYTAGKEEFVRSILDRAMNKTPTESSDNER